MSEALDDAYERAEAREMAGDAANDFRDSVQAFFAELAASIVAPHVDDRYKKNIEELLKRATERGLYTP